MKEPAHKEFERFLEKARIPWQTSRQDAWERLEEMRKKEVPERRPGLSISGRRWMAAAAAAVLLLAVGGFLRFKTDVTVVPAHERATLHLPDGSVAEINADTRISYHPYWWKISREIHLEGEAFFKVEKGSKFSVVSPQGSAEVLGTTFNVLARDGNYIVDCHTGKVGVSSRRTGEQVVLEQWMEATLDQKGSLEVTPMESRNPEPGWMEHPFLLFSSTPLEIVIGEIEKHYGIEIRFTGDPGLKYSGNFSLDIPPEKALSLLCRPFNLTYEKISGNTYLIHRSDQ